MQAPGAEILADLQVEAAIVDESKKLKHEDPVQLAKGLAALCMLVGQLPQRIPDAFFNKLGRVTELLGHGDVHVQVGGGLAAPAQRPGAAAASGRPLSRPP
jgi:hypothetical protein